VTDSKLSASQNVNKVQGFTSQKLNFVLAICAILISAASFYATYLQASAAEKQVKAMTLPLVQYETSNLDEKTYDQVIEFTLVNHGVGPALIKSVQLTYKNKSYQSIHQVIQACCSKAYKEFVEKVDLDIPKGSFVTSDIINRIIPAQQKIKFYRLFKGEVSHKLWQKLNDERHHLKVDICYCSLLDKCYLTKKNNISLPTQSCPIK